MISGVQCIVRAGAANPDIKIQAIVDVEGVKGLVDDEPWDIAAEETGGGARVADDQRDGAVDVHTGVQGVLKEVGDRELLSFVEARTALKEFFHRLVTELAELINQFHLQVQLLAVMDTFRVLTALAELRERVAVMRMLSATSGTFAGGFGKMTLRGGTMYWEFRRRRSIRSETDALVPQRHRVGVVHSTVAILAQERLVRCAIPVRSLNPAHIARPR
jgi:hypothetical protein